MVDCDPIRIIVCSTSRSLQSTRNTRKTGGIINLRNQSEEPISWLTRRVRRRQCPCSGRAAVSSGRLLAAASSSFEIAAEARPLLAAASRYLSSRMKVMSIGLEDLADGALRPAQRARVPNSGGRGRGARRCREAALALLWHWPRLKANVHIIFYIRALRRFSGDPQSELYVTGGTTRVPYKVSTPRA